MNLSILESRIDGIVVLGLSGEVDLSTIPRLADALTRVLARTNDRVAIDLDGATVLDDAALGILLGAASRLSLAGGELSLIVTNEKIRALLESTRLDEIVSVHSSVGALVRSRS